MNQHIAQELLEPFYFRERRKNERCREVHLFGISGQGTGKILNISRDGLSFGCLYRQDFPTSWFMDVIDARGAHLKQLRVRKVWELHTGHPESSGCFAMEIGVEFMGLTNRQDSDLDLLLANLCFMDRQNRPAFPLDFEGV